MAAIVNSAPKTMSIGEVARVSDTPATTLRFYGRRGLIDAPERRGGQRRYETSVLARLMVIKFCRIAGLSLDDIERVIADRSPERSMTKTLAYEQLGVIDAQLVELKLARRMMHAVTECSCGNFEACTCRALTPVLIELRNRIG